MSLKENLMGLNTATPRSAALLADLFVPISFKKGTILSTPDHSFPLLYFVEQGLLRGYFFYHQDEYTAWTLKHGFMLPSGAFFSTAPSIEYVEFVEDTEAWSLNLSKAETLAQREPLMYRMILEIYEIHLLQGKRRELMLRLKFAEDRFLYAQKFFHSVLENVGNAIAASFMSIEKKYFFKFRKKHQQ